MVVLGLVALVGCGRTSPFFLYDDVDVLPQVEDDPITDGCDKVDYLFVIDNSASMADYQRRLVNNFPTFVRGVERTQDALSSVHVGVVTTDRYLGNPEECRELGDLVTQTRGYNSSNETCGPYAEGHRFMTEKDDLDEAFACAAQVGTEGSTEEGPLRAIGYGLNSARLSDGACNAGFIREDALLVLVIVTDEDEEEGSMIDFAYERAVSVKNGRDDNVVAVTIALAPDGPCTPFGYAKIGTNVTSFAQSFEHSFVGPVCADDYGPTFEAAVDVVQRACG